MSGWNEEGGETAVFRTPDDLLVVEARLLGPHEHDLRRLIAESRAAGADVLWVHGFVADASLGFKWRGGYARLEAEQPPSSVELAAPPWVAVRELQRACFSGVWGHTEPDEPDPSASFVALNEGFEWVGVCEFDVDAGCIDGPGVIPDLRTPDRYARLVRGAAAHMRGGPMTLETWGDSTPVLAAYQELGFRLVDYVPGWELKLGIDEVPGVPS